MVGVAILVGLQIGLFAYTYFTREEEDERDPNNKRRGSTTVAEEGSTIPLVYGTCRVRKTNIILYNGSESFSDYLRDSWSEIDDVKVYGFDGILGVCARPIANASVQFLRHWAGDSLLIDSAPHNQLTSFNKPDLWGGRKNGGGMQGSFRTQDGRLDQTEEDVVKWFIFGLNGPYNTTTLDHYGSAPGVCTTIAFINEIGERASMPGISIEMSVLPDYSGAPVPILSTVAGVGNENEANPAACLYQLLTEEWIGLGLNTNRIDADSFSAAANILSFEGNGFSMVFDKATKADKIIKEIIKQIDGILYLDPEDQKLYLELVREDYDVSILPSYNDSNVVKVVSYKETSWEDTYNEVRLEYEDRASDYNEKFAIAQDAASAGSSNRLKTMDVKFPGVKVSSTANKIAARELKFFATPQTHVSLHINRQGSSIRPGAVIKWSCEAYQITDMVLRVHKVALSEADDGVIVIDTTRDKYSEVSTVFRDPDRHWLEDVFEKPTLPGCYDVIEPPPNPVGDGGSNWNTPLFGGGLIVNASPLTSGGGTNSGPSLSTVNVNDGPQVASTGDARESTPCGEVGVAYSSSPGAQYYYDTTTGLQVSFSGSAANLLRNSTESEVREGRAILSIGDEFLSYESYTDTDAPTYRSSSQTETAADQTDISIALPAGVIDGDLMIALINLGPEGLAAAPAGWAHVTGSPLLNSGQGSDNNFVVMTKTAASETGPYVWSRNDSHPMEIQGSIHAFVAGAEVDFATMRSHHGTPASGLNENFYSGRSLESDVVLTGISISDSWWSGSSLILPTSGFTEIDDSSSAIDGHLQVQYGPSPITGAGAAIVDLNLAGVPPESSYSTVLIGIKGPETRTYTLNNVWRGLFDTAPVDHGVGTPVFFLSEADLGKTTTQKRFSCINEELVVELQPRAQGERLSEEPDKIYSAVQFTQRGQRPLRPTAFTLRDGGPDAAATGPEVDYAYNDAKTLEVVYDLASGADEKLSSAGSFGDVWTNDLRGTWNRRPTIKTCEAGIVVRGDDADEAYGEKENTSLRVEVKGDQEASWKILAKEDIQGNPIRGNIDFVDMSQAPSGPGEVRLCALGESAITGEELMSREAETLAVTVHTSRQLLRNRDFVPYWDIDGDSSVAYGDGKLFPGNPVYQARAWTNITAGGGRPRYKVMPSPLVQGDGTKGFAFTGEFVDGEYVNVEQVVAVPYLDTLGSEIDLSWRFMNARVGDEFTVTINTLDVNGAVLDTATTTQTPSISADEWAKYTLSLTGMSAAVRSIQVKLGLQTLLTSSGPAISRVSMVMGRDIATDQLLDSDFDALTNWTNGAGGTWTLQTSDGALVPVDATSTNFVRSGATDSELYQDVAIPAGYGAGDYIRVQYWTANTASPGYGYAVVTARDGVATPLDSITIGGTAHPSEDQWYFHEGYIKIPGECADVRVLFSYKANGGGGSDFAVDEADLTFIKGSNREIELNWKHTSLQAKPTTRVAFATATGSKRLVPDHIFPMEDGSGVAPVDVVFGATFDTPVGTVDEDYSFGSPSYGFYNGVDHSSTKALEISTAGGGVSCSDPEFLNPNNRSFGIYLQYSIVEGDSGTTVSILRKGGDHVTPAVGDVTFQLHYDETTHRVHMALAYNSTAAGSFTANAYVDGTVDDACNHWLYAKVNFTDQTVSVFGDTGVGTSTSIATMLDAIEAASEKFENTTDLVEIGTNSDLNANDNPIKLPYMAILRGKSSELFERSHGQTMWTHGVCPNIADTGYTIDYTRTSRAAYQIEADKVALWAGSGGGGDVQVPMEYSGDFSGDDLLGLGSFPALENLATYANKISTQWTASNATVPTARLISERGYREMQVVDATSNGGYYYRDFTGLSASTTYRVSWFARTETGSHSARVEVTQNDLATTLASLEPALTVTRGRYTFTFTTQVAQTQLRMKIFGGTAATQTNTGYHGIMLTVGTEYGPVIYNDVDQDGTTETLAAQTQVLNVAGNVLTSPDEGSVYALFIQAVQDTGSTRTIFDILSDGSNEDRRTMRIVAAGQQESVAYNAAGGTYHTTTQHAAIGAGVETERTTKWRRKANLASGAYTLEDDITSPASTVSATGTANTEGTGGHTRVFIACRNTGSGQLAGPLQTLKIYTGEARDFTIAQAAVNPPASSFTAQTSLLSGGGVTDHGALSGLTGTDHHTQYVANTGTRFDAGQTLAHSAANDSTVLTISKAPVGAQSGSALQLTMGANATGPALSITNGGSGDAISAGPNTDQSFLLGRTRIDSRVSDYSYFSHYDNSSTVQFALRQSAAGATVVNSAAGQSVSVMIGGALQYVFPATAGQGFHGNDTAAGAVMNEVSTSVNPTLVPNRGDWSTGVGGVVGTMSLITAGTEALLLDASQNAHFAGSAYLGLGQRIYFDDDLDTYMYANSDDSLWVYVGGAATSRFLANAIFTYGSYTSSRDVGTGTTSSSHKGIRLVADQAASDPGAREKYSPIFEFQARAWDDTAVLSRAPHVYVQLRTTAGAAVDSQINFRGSRDGVTTTEFGYIKAGLTTTDGLLNFGKYEARSGGASDPALQAGTVDPTAASGVAAPEGSLFMRYVSTAGEVWHKTGAADTAWTQLGVGSTHPDPHLLADGTALLPAYSYASEPTLGWYRAAASDLRLAWGSAYRYRFSSSGLSINLGTSTTLARVYLASSATSGLGFPAADEISIITAGTEASRWDASQNQITAAFLAVNKTAIGTSPLTVDGGTVTNRHVLLLDNCGAGTTGIRINNGSTNAQLWGTTGTRWNCYMPNRTVRFNVTNDAYDAATQAFEFSQGTSTPTRHTMLIPAASDITTGNLLRLQDDYAAELEHVALNLVNETVATTGVQKFSPMHVMEGRGFYTAGSSQAVKIATQLQPVEQATNPIANLVWKGSIENVAVGAYSDIMKLSWDGTNTELEVDAGAATGGATIGRTRMDSRAASYCYLSYYSLTTTSNYALRQSSGGATVINAATGTQIWFLNNNGSGFEVNASRFESRGASGAAINYGNATSTAPTLIPDKTALTSGISHGSIAGEVNVVTSGTEATRWDTSQNATFFGNISAVENTNGTFIFGRTRIDSRTSDHAIFSHYDQSSTTQFAIKHSSAGYLTLNTANTMALAIAGTNKFYMSNTAGFFGAASGSGKLLNEVGSNTNPTLIPNGLSQAVGIGGVSGTVSVITTSGEAVRFESDKTTTFKYHVQPTLDSLYDLGTTALRWRNVYLDDLIVTTSGTFGGDIDAAGGFRRALDAVWVDTPVANTEYQMRRDGALSPSTSDIHGWHVAARAGSAVELVAYVDTDVTATQVNFWVMKSTDGGDTFSDWWGTAAAPVVSLKFGGSTEVNYQADAKGTNTFNAGDIFMIMIKPLTGWNGGRYFYAQMTIEC